ncbi:MAG: hypothetical protein ACM37W_08320 [Actinomycetota bacterium]
MKLTHEEAVEKLRILSEELAKLQKEYRIAFENNDRATMKANSERQAANYREANEVAKAAGGYIK